MAVCRLADQADSGFYIGAYLASGIFHAKPTSAGTTAAHTAVSQLYHSLLSAEPVVRSQTLSYHLSQKDIQQQQDERNREYPVSIPVILIIAAHDFYHCLPSLNSR